MILNIFMILKLNQITGVTRSDLVTPVSLIKKKKITTSKGAEPQQDNENVATAGHL